jgi:hypothetical protein
MVCEEFAFPLRCRSQSPFVSVKVWKVLRFGPSKPGVEEIPEGHDRLPEGVRRSTTEPSCLGHRQRFFEIGGDARVEVTERVLQRGRRQDLKLSLSGWVMGKGIWRRGVRSELASEAHVLAVVICFAV